MALAADVGNDGRDLEVEETGDAHEIAHISLVFSRQGSLQRNLDVEGSVLTSHATVSFHQLSGRSCAPPPELVSAGHLILHLGTLHRHTSIGLG